MNKGCSQKKKNLTTMHCLLCSNCFIPVASQFTPESSGGLPHDGGHGGGVGDEEEGGDRRGFVGETGDAAVWRRRQRSPTCLVQSSPAARPAAAPWWRCGPYFFFWGAVGEPVRRMRNERRSCARRPSDVARIRFPPSAPLRYPCHPPRRRLRARPDQRQPPIRQRRPGAHPARLRAPLTLREVSVLPAS